MSDPLHPLPPSVAVSESIASAAGSRPETSTSTSTSPGSAAPSSSSVPSDDKQGASAASPESQSAVHKLLSKFCSLCDIDVDTLHDVVAKQEVIEKYRIELLEDGVDPMDDMFVELKGMLNKLDMQRIFYENALGVDLQQEMVQKHHQNHTMTVAMYLYQIKMVLDDPTTGQVKAQVICNAVFELEMLRSLIQHMKFMRSDEVRRCVVSMVQFVFRHDPERSCNYFLERPDLCDTLIQGYRDVDIALHCGPILRILIRQQPLCKLMLESSSFMSFFEHVQQKSFEISSDAFSTFKRLLTRHQTLSAGFLEANATELFTRWNEMMCGRNYVAKRQAINFLTDLVMERSNFKFMMKYLSSVENLDVVLSLLMGRSAATAHDSFSLFKIFVLNPRKTVSVQRRLVKQREKVAPFLIRMLAEQKQKGGEATLPQLQQVLETYLSMEKPPKKKKKKHKKKKKSSSSSSSPVSGGGGSGKGMSNQILLQGAITKAIDEVKPASVQTSPASAAHPISQESGPWQAGGIVTSVSADSSLSTPKAVPLTPTSKGSGGGGGGGGGGDGGRGRSNTQWAPYHNAPAGRVQITDIPSSALVSLSAAQPSIDTSHHHHHQQQQQQEGRGRSKTVAASGNPDYFIPRTPRMQDLLPSTPVLSRNSSSGSLPPKAIPRPAGLPPIPDDERLRSVSLELPPPLQTQQLPHTPSSHHHLPQLAQTPLAATPKIRPRANTLQEDFLPTPFAVPLDHQTGGEGEGEVEFLQDPMRMKTVVKRPSKFQLAEAEFQSPRPQQQQQQQQ